MKWNTCLSWLRGNILVLFVRLFVLKIIMGILWHSVQKPPYLGKSTNSLKTLKITFLSPNGNNQAIKINIYFENGNFTRLKCKILLRSQLDRRVKPQNKKKSRTLARRAANVIKFSFTSTTHPWESCLTLLNTETVWTQ